MQLRQLHEHLWIAEMPYVFFGVPAGARMTVARRGGELWLHSPIEISAELRAEIESLGAVTRIVAPNNFHYLHLEEAAQMFPAATIFATPAVVKKLKIEAQAPEKSGDGNLQALRFRGNRAAQETVFFHVPSRTLILTDLSFNLHDFPTAWAKLAAKIYGADRGFGPSRLMKLTTRNKAAARQSIRKILSWDFERIVFSHGAILEENGKEQFQRAWSWL